MVKFSFVVPAYNEAKYIEDTLKALRHQTLTDFEIIVKDGQSRDDTIKIAKQYADKIVSISDSSAGEARNHGAKNADGEILVFVDADTLLPPDTLERFHSIFARQNVVGGSCRKIPLSHSIFDRLLYEFVNLSTYISCKLGLGGAHGNCMFIRRHVFDKVGGFNPEIIVAEEQELVRRTLKFGKHIFLLDTCVLENPRRLKKWGRLRLYKAWFIGMFRSFMAGKKQSYEKVR